MRILVAVMSCHNHRKMWSKIKKNLIDDFIIFSYSPKKENWYDKNEKILYLKCRDTYDCLPEKVICMIDQVLHNSIFDKYTHILKIDDHEAENLTMEKIKNLHNYHELNMYDYVGQNLLSGASPTSNTYHFGKVHKESRWYNLPYIGKYVPWLNGGRTYILNRKAMKCINGEYNSTDIDILYKNEIYEDLMISKILNKYNIFPHELNYNI